MPAYQSSFTILLVDCSEQITSAFRNLKNVDLIVKSSKIPVTEIFKNARIDLVTIGAVRFPVKNIFMNQVRRFYPKVPLLILRREQKSEINGGREFIRGEFILADEVGTETLKVVTSISKIFPIESSERLSSGADTELVNEALRIIRENYQNPDLNLPAVADKIFVSPSKLSRVLNHRLGVSFRKLLKQVRIDESKKMLASHRFSVKEVAARAGFSDSHYFSRTFKEVTGTNATAYKRFPSDAFLLK